MQYVPRRVTGALGGTFNAPLGAFRSRVVPVADNRSSMRLPNGLHVGLGKGLGPELAAALARRGAVPVRGPLLDPSQPYPEGGEWGESPPIAAARGGYAGPPQSYADAPYSGPPGVGAPNSTMAAGLPEPTMIPPSQYGGERPPTRLGAAVSRAGEYWSPAFRMASEPPSRTVPLGQPTPAGGALQALQQVPPSATTTRLPTEPRADTLDPGYVGGVPYVGDMHDQLPVPMPSPAMAGNPAVPMPSPAVATSPAAPMPSPASFEGTPAQTGLQISPAPGGGPIAPRPRIKPDVHTVPVDPGAPPSAGAGGPGVGMPGVYPPQPSINTDPYMDEVLKSAKAIPGRGAALTPDERAWSLMTAGLGMMAAGSQPGATGLGAIAQGGLAGVQEARRIKAANRAASVDEFNKSVAIMKLASDRKDAADNLALNQAELAERTRHNQATESAGGKVMKAQLQLAKKDVELAVAKAKLEGGLKTENQIWTLAKKMADADESSWKSDEFDMFGKPVRDAQQWARNQQKYAKQLGSNMTGSPDGASAAPGQQGGAERPTKASAASVDTSAKANKGRIAVGPNGERVRSDGERWVPVP